MLSGKTRDFTNTIACIIDDLPEALSPIIGMKLGKLYIEADEMNLKFCMDIDKILNVL